MEPPLISKEALLKAFDYSFDGYNTADKRRLLEQSLLKRLAGHYNCSTMLKIMRELKLIASSTNNITRKGKEVIFEAYNNGQGV